MGGVSTDIAGPAARQRLYERQQTSVTLAAVVAPLVAYAVFFQTALYVALPTRLRTRVAPLVTGVVGACVSLFAGVVFGFDRIGLTGGDALIALSWGGAAVATMAFSGLVMMRLPGKLLADPRLAGMGPFEFGIQVFVRIPVFTALIEEAFFRGVLHAALMALYPVEVAVWLGAGMFGVWHIGPGLDQARAGDRAGLRHTSGTVVATTLAGIFLVWLRIETGSIWAPVAVHAAINMTMAISARLALRPV